MCTTDELRDSINKLTTKLDGLKNDFEKHEEKGWDIHEKYIAAQEQNTIALKRLANKTHDMVEAWEAAEGVVKVGSYIGKFVKWISGFAVLAGILHWAGIHIPDIPK